MKYLRSEVTTEGTPCCTVKSGADVVLVAGDDFGGRKSSRAIREDG